MIFEVIRASKRWCKRSPAANNAFRIERPLAKAFGVGRSSFAPPQFALSWYMKSLRTQRARRPFKLSTINFLRDSYALS